MTKVKEYISKIVDKGSPADMHKLSCILEDLIDDMKEEHYDKYCEYKVKLYEILNGEKLTDELSKKWVAHMEPAGEHWTMEETTNAKNALMYSDVNNLDFYVVANMMYNDYYDIVKDDETLALRLARDWLKDTDAKDNKLYEYYKHIAEKM